MKSHFSHTIGLTRIHSFSILLARISLASHSAINKDHSSLISLSFDSQTNPAEIPFELSSLKFVFAFPPFNSLKVPFSKLRHHQTKLTTPFSWRIKPKTKLFKSKFQSRSELLPSGSYRSPLIQILLSKCSPYIACAVWIIICDELMHLCHEFLKIISAFWNFCSSFLSHFLK